MRINLTDTNAGAIAAELVRGRRRAGSPAMGMVLTLIVVVDEKQADDALAAAEEASKEHPARILGVIIGSRQPASQVDAEIRIGAGTTGETVLLWLRGEVTGHSESVVTPLLLADSPVVVWWPSRAPDDPAAEPLGALAQRRITDAAGAPRQKQQAMSTQCRHYSPGNTDLAWTRITGWRAMLAAALDQHPAKVTAASVRAERVSPSADLLAAWLTARLRVPVERNTSRGPGITQVVMRTGDGEIRIERPDGVLASLTLPGQPDRPVALKRRSVAELLAEELRRLDPDEIYEQTVASMVKIEKQKAKD
ncbi:MAG TPA: glucose-6-phosphate dehydrogenase assembly protein OpcA [Nocardioidaceae bacterium]|nr:glucose-6-phosphate dehydrogenase assembly protein OpcA [Nocardioidaceae bacterium]